MRWIGTAPQCFCLPRTSQENVQARTRPPPGGPIPQPPPPDPALIPGTSCWKTSEANGEDLPLSITVHLVAVILRTLKLQGTPPPFRQMIFNTSAIRPPALHLFSSVDVGSFCPPPLAAVAAAPAAAGPASTVAKTAVVAAFARSAAATAVAVAVAAAATTSDAASLGRELVRTRLRPIPPCRRTRPKYPLAFPAYSAQILTDSIRTRPQNPPPPCKQLPKLFAGVVGMIGDHARFARSREDSRHGP